MTPKGPKPLFSPASFYKQFMQAEYDKRAKELEQFGMDEIQSSRGWFGWELPGCEWSDSWHPSIDVANYRSWPRIAPKWILQVKKNGNYTCMLRKKALHYMQPREWEKLIKRIDSVKNDYPLVDDYNQSEVESEYQDEAWRETYRKEFQEALVAKFDGVFLEPRQQQKFEELVNSDELTDELFYHESRNFNGGEWTEHNDGTWSLDVDDVVKGLDTHDIASMLWPEDPRQLRLQFPESKELAEVLLNDEYVTMVQSPTAHRIVDILLEEQHSKSCVLINLPKELAEHIKAWGLSNVKAEDVYVDEHTKGRETDPHVTVLYGLFDAKPSDQLLQVFEHTAPFDIHLGPVKIFRQDKYDVVVLSVISPFLHQLNQNIRMVAAFENDYPEYDPHCTIAYVKPGTCDRLEGASPWQELKM